jgi:hypothetical protein
MGLLCLLLSMTTQAQDLGAPSMSTLTWDHISSFMVSRETASSIGLTTDKKMYVWGTNYSYTIHTNKTTTDQPIWQQVPFYVPSPAGETIKKVKIKGSIISSFHIPTYFCLSESGKLYAWGSNNGLLGSAWVIQTADAHDSTKTVRSPVQLTILGESSFVDFDSPRKDNYWIAIGASGKAYHIGSNGIVAGGGSNYASTFAVLPNPAGVNSATFKYTNVWVSTQSTNAEMPIVYLKGNNGKIYFTGQMASAFSIGVPSLYSGNSPTLTTAESYANIRSITPYEVPFPVGEDIVSVQVISTGIASTNYALSASGKAYMAGAWRTLYSRAGGTGGPYGDYRTFVTVPLKSAPVLGTELDARYINSGNFDSLYVIKKFVEIATPPNATKILDIMTPSEDYGATAPLATLVVDDNNKVYWSGSNYNIIRATIHLGNYISQPNSLYYSVDQCRDIQNAHTNGLYSWSVEAINYRGAAKIFRTAETGQICIISKTGRGYFVGNLYANTGVGKVYTSAVYFSYFPLPIANEVLANCNPSPGTGGTWTSGPIAPTNTAVGTIDCAKTQLVPAPKVGTPSNLSLIVTVNVTTKGTFTPITVSGSGMTVDANFIAVTTDTTGIQQFVIPVHYDGTALGTLNFTVGSAGTCAANLSNLAVRPVNKPILTLDNCAAIVPGTLTK